MSECGYDWLRSECGYGGEDCGMDDDGIDKRLVALGALVGPRVWFLKIVRSNSVGQKGPHLCGTPMCVSKKPSFLLPRCEPFIFRCHGKIAQNACTY